MKKLASISLLSIATLMMAALAIGNFSHAAITTPQEGITVQADGSPTPPPKPHGGPRAVA